MRIFLLGKDYQGERLYRLSQSERHYLMSVLRLKVNDVFTAQDKDGKMYKAFLFDEATLALEETDRPEETLLDGLSSYRGPFADITMLVSLLKGRKNETEIRMLTEMGIRRIVLMETEFTEKASHRQERYDRIVKEAVQQSGSRPPELIGPVPFSEALSLVTGKALLMHQSERQETLDLFSALEGVTGAVSCLIGPEGGFSGKECEAAEASGAQPVLLRTNILRAETAAVYSAAVIQSILHSRHS